MDFVPRPRTASPNAARLRPALPCALAPLLFALAPACLAQDAESDDARDVAVEQSTEHKPRSAFGRVMSLMIAALKENAERPQPAALVPGQAREVAGPDVEGGGVQQIQVSSAFRLDPPAPGGGARAAIAPLAGAPDGD